MPDTYEDIRRRLFDVAWETPAYAPQAERTVSRARRRAATTIGGGVLAAALALVVAATSIPAGPEDRTADLPSGTDEREFLVDISSGRVTEISGLPTMHRAWWIEASPDGTQVAFTSETAGTQHVYVANLDGTGLRQVTGGSADVREPRWSPSGDEIAYVALDATAVRQIHVVDLVTGRTRRITRESHDVWGAEWSPDGRSIVYSVSISAEPSGVEEGYYYVNATLNIMRSVEVRTGRIEKVIGGPETMAYDGVWTPDGILFVRGLDQEKGVPARVDLAVLDRAGRVRSVLALPVTYWDEVVWSPQLSPDGTKIAYLLEGGGTIRVFIADLRTGQTRELRGGHSVSWVDADTLLIQDGAVIGRDHELQ